MITAEIRVNTALIGHVYCIRETKIPLPSGKDLYSVSYYHPESEQLVTFQLEHEREKGAVNLMKKIFSKLDKKIKLD